MRAISPPRSQALLFCCSLSGTLTRSQSRSATDRFHPPLRPYPRFPFTSASEKASSLRKGLTWK